MDLGAYENIETLTQIAKLNNIEVPRLRGYRLMAYEKPIDIKSIINDKQIEVNACLDLCRSDPFWDPNTCCSELSSYTDYLCDYFNVKTKDEDGYTNYTEVRWNRIHGKKRKILKFEIKKAKKRIIQQYEMWNKFCGKPDVLYIHSRIGGNNWAYYGGPNLITLPWFLDKVDDHFDSTYCDIYAKIDPETIKNMQTSEK